MFVLSRVLYGELGVTNYDVVAPQPRDDGVSDGDCDGNDRMYTDRDDAHGDKDARPPRSVLRESFGRIREFLLNHAFLFSSNEEEFDGGGVGRRAAPVDTVPLHARPNLIPMRASRRRRQSDSRVCRDSTKHDVPVPREGNCHAFVAGHRGAAVLNVLFPPYD
jgi:hypothetical protein